DGAAVRAVGRLAQLDDDRHAMAAIADAGRERVGDARLAAAGAVGEIEAVGQRRGYEAELAGVERAVRAMRQRGDELPGGDARRRGLAADGGGGAELRQPRVGDEVGVGAA